MARSSSDSKSQRSSAVPMNRLRKKRQNGFSGFLHLPAVRLFLRLARIILVGYVILTLVATWAITAGVGKQPKITITEKDFPAGQKLKLQHRRRQDNTDCKGYGAPEDPYFLEYGGKFCGSVKYEVSNVASLISAPSAKDENGIPVEQLKRVELTYKVFESDHHATEYFWRFWGIHSHSILPSSTFMGVTDKVGMVGNEHRALYYNPGLLINPHVREEYQSAHLMYFFRMGKAVMILSASGFPNTQSPMVNPQLMITLGNHVVDRMFFPSAVMASVRSCALALLRWGQMADNAIADLLNTPNHLMRMVKLATSVDSSTTAKKKPSTTLQSAKQDLSDTATATSTSTSTFQATHQPSDAKTEHASRHSYGADDIAEDEGDEKGFDPILMVDDFYDEDDEMVFFDRMDNNTEEPMAPQVKPTAADNDNCPDGSVVPNKSMFAKAKTPSELLNKISDAEWLSTAIAGDNLNTTSDPISTTSDATVFETLIDTGTRADNVDDSNTTPTTRSSTSTSSTRIPKKATTTTTTTITKTKTKTKKKTMVKPTTGWASGETTPTRTPRQRSKIQGLSDISNLNVGDDNDDASEATARAPENSNLYHGLTFGSHVDLSEDLDYRGVDENFSENSYSTSTMLLSSISMHSETKTNSNPNAQSSADYSEMSFSFSLLKQQVVDFMRLHLGSSTASESAHLNLNQSTINQPAELLSSAKIVLIVFLLIAAGELLDPPNSKQTKRQQQQH